MTDKAKAKPLVWLAILIVLVGLPFTCHIPASAGAFDPPTTDPWYCQSDSDWRFLCPDKVQHFYGSQLLVDIGLHPVTAFMFGFIYEVYQAKTDIGFSYRDVIANSFGVLAGTVNGRAFYLFMDYSSREQILKLNVVLMF